jgi:hypothetical protein
MLIYLPSVKGSAEKCGKMQGGAGWAQAKLTAFQLEYIIIQQLFKFIIISEYLDYKRDHFGTHYFFVSAMRPAKGREDPSS